MNPTSSHSGATVPSLDTLSNRAELEREFDFKPKDFERVRTLIYERAGIVLAPHKRDMVYSRLSRRLRALGLNRFSDYLDLVERDDENELQAFTNALTTNLTVFFREPHHFSILDEQLGRLKGKSRIAIWCSAASTGEEPYSLAMTVAEHFGTLKPPVDILATDLDTQVLEFGARGIYPMDRVDKMSAARLKRFFRRGTGANEGHCRVIDELRQMITFRQLNLLDASWPMKGPFDAIFCRNVMIYFDKPTQLRVLRHMAPLLTPEGLLYTGHSESFLHAADVVKSVGRTVYRRAGASGGGQ
jgi:chemotaxis protein methyltransferase CheR